MKRLIYISTLFFALCQTGCVEDVFVEVDPAEQRMVISSLFIPDSLLIVTVSRSFSALSGKDLESLSNDFIASLLVDKALVTIESAGLIDTLTQLSPGIYAGGVENVNPLDFYHLEVYDSISNTTVSSTTQLKPQVRFDKVSIDEKINGNDTSSYLSYEFTDPADEDNWYVVQGFELPRLPNYDNVNFDVENGDVIVKPDTSNQVFFEPKVTLLFSDLISDLTIEDNKAFDEIQIPKSVNDTVVFVLVNVDEEYYDFLQARKRSGGFVTSFTREPVNHPTNVEGGYGYFTMHLPHFRAFIRKDEN